MNKKLFTLAAALMMGSAFTVNAQTQQVKDGTPLNGGAWYYIADAVSPSSYIAGVKDGNGNTVITTISSSAVSFLKMSDRTHTCSGGSYLLPVPGARRSPVPFDGGSHRTGTAPHRAPSPETETAADPPQPPGFQRR